MVGSIINVQNMLNQPTSSEYSFFYRVARVCKRDTGGKNILAQNWATYLKVRLNCSIPGEFPFFFNEIQDVYKAGLVTNAT